MLSGLSSISHRNGDTICPSMDRVHSMISSCVPFFGREKNEIFRKRGKIRQEKREREEKKEKKKQERGEKY